jgi:hypothetical protein
MEVQMRLIFCLVLAPFWGSFIAAHQADFEGESHSFHNGIEYCECYGHCCCFSTYLAAFPSDKLTHPIDAIDQAWHEFMKGILSAKKAGPFFDLNDFQSDVRLNRHSNSQVHFLSDYLDIIDRFKQLIIQARNRNINRCHKIYSSSYEQETLNMRLSTIEDEYKNAMQILNELPGKITPLYRQAMNHCFHNSPSTLYQRGLAYSLEGQWDLALEEIRRLIDLQSKTTLSSKIFQACGEACLEVNLFHDAIDALTTAIEKNPRNKSAYFFRAAAYFETGNFDSALKDYLDSDRGSGMVKQLPVSLEFTKALLDSACKGAIEGAVEFIPSFCHSVYGLGRTLWVTTQHPVESAQQFAGACYDMGEAIVDYCKTVDQETLKGYVDQIKTLYERYDQLSETEKGELIGFTVGKFGVDLFAGAGIVKCVSKYQALKNANRICNLEAMFLTQNEERIVISSALKHATERETYLKNVKYNFDAHNKHIRGHNDFIKTGSEWEHKDPEQLLKHFAGKGIPGGNRTPGSYGYRETVDFGEHIGIWRSLDGKTQLPTSRGTIHYGKKGAHIVPSKPNSEIPH